MLALTRHPAATPTDAPPLVIAHGLFGTGRNWGVIARRLADIRDVCTVDMRNHGDSPRSTTHGYPDLAADLAEVARHIGAPIDLLGHSMGGKAAMQLALTEPALIRRLIVADIAPVAYAHDQTRHIDAMRALDLTGLSTRAEADRRLSAHIDDAGLRAFFLQSLDLKAAGGPRWRLNFDTLAAEMPKIVGWPETSGRFDHPALFLTGSESHYVKAEYRDKIRSLFPKARFARIAGAGHWLHAEKPREFEETVRVFLTAPESAPAPVTA
ncbi:alpha/beta fold hydrolase [Paragemmobacter straminiformis]|uniref:Alpha/beta fold hydrolase n=1 Tax=Paragemmobacter straminiformis TaxID=2045119 RepID=A0A842I345_9RHOB|nr:alpha/beta fold hydrolase [Gemmobacter straminiformis]MBC2834129.1 alpha/beta fold hydrolase [Gemmobacter straminiformis]